MGETIQRGPSTRRLWVASFVAMLVCLPIMGLLIGLSAVLFGNEGAWAIAAMPVAALMFGWFVFPIPTLLGIVLFAAAGHRLTTAERNSGQRRRLSWIAGGAIVGLLVGASMMAEFWLRDPVDPQWASAIFLFCGCGAVTGIVGLFAWRGVIDFPHGGSPKTS
jgi:hypothetical protein